MCSYVPPSSHQPTRSAALPAQSIPPAKGATITSRIVLVISHDPFTVPRTPRPSAKYIGTVSLVSLGPCSEIIKTLPANSTRYAYLLEISGKGWCKESQKHDPPMPKKRNIHPIMTLHLSNPASKISHYQAIPTIQSH